jgi:uncharacterized oligopeptide transporter (OPT) family protein
MAAGDMMQDLKCGACARRQRWACRCRVDIIVSHHVCLPGVPGHILGASPRAQFGGQLLGTCASIFFSVAAWTLYSSMYHLRDIIIVIRSLDWLRFTYILRC